MTAVLIDANVLLDIMTEDALWFAWSAGAIERAAERYRLVINPVIYGEVSLGIRRSRNSTSRFQEPCSTVKQFRAKPPFSQASRSWPIDGEAEQSNRRFPIFSSVAHAAIAGYRLMTRDAARYLTYFPKLPLILPEP